MSSADRFSKHDPRMISVFEIIGSYFVDVVFNHVYGSAQTNVSNGSSLTDEFIHRSMAYMTGIKSDKECYGRAVNSLHRYFTSSTRYTTISFANFVDLIVGIYIPEDYFRQFTTADKDEILSSILCDLISNLTVAATQPDMLRRIIDEHNQSPSVTIRMLQDSAVSILIAKRSALINKFVHKMGQAREHVSMDVVEEMKITLRRLVKEKIAAEARAKEAEDSLGELKAKYRELREREGKLLKLVAMLRDSRNHGPAAAGMSLRVPPRETIAEDPLDLTKEASPIPRRDTIAEEKPREDYQPKPREDYQPKPRNSSIPPFSKNKIGSNFFSDEIAPATYSQASQAPSSSSQAPSSSSQAPSSSSQAPPASQAASRPRPAAVASLFSDEQDLDSILYGDN
jgi:hypothetical protein